MNEGSSATGTSGDATGTSEGTISSDGTISSEARTAREGAPSSEPAPPAPDRIYLAGFMGSGKSTVAPLLAERLEYAVLELDEAIVERTGRAIPEIFDEDGEETFRRLERTLLRETAERNDLVVSLGGGAVADPENLEFVRAHGTVVYLQVDPETLTDRLFGQEGRPLLRDEEGHLLTREELRDRIRTMLDARASFYRQAHLIVDAGAPSPGETVEEILEGIGSG